MIYVYGEENQYATPRFIINKNTQIGYIKACIYFFFKMQTDNRKLDFKIYTYRYKLTKKFIWIDDATALAR